MDLRSQVTPRLIVTTLLGIGLTSGLAADPVITKSLSFTVDARPEAIAMDTTHTAVIVVDMQNDFGAKGGMFDQCGADISRIQDLVAPTAKVLAAARLAGIKIIYLKMGFRPDLSDLGGQDSVNRVRYLKAGVGQTVQAPDGREGRILIRDTWNTDILEGLKPEPTDVVIYKTRFSGFYETELDAMLKKNGIRHLIVTGCTTSVCVDSTIRDAMFRDYLCIALKDCMSEPVGDDLPRSNHEASLAVVEHALGWVSDSGRLTKALQDRTPARHEGP